MTLAACLAFYGVLTAVVAPRLLPYLTASGTAPRLGIAVWTSAVAGVLASWIGAAVVAVLSASEWSGQVADLVRSCLDALRPWSAHQPLAAALMAVIAVLAAVWLGWSAWRIGSHWICAHR